MRLIINPRPNPDTLSLSKPWFYTENKNYYVICIAKREEGYKKWE